MNKESSMKKFKKEFPKAGKVVGYSSHIDIIYHDKAFWLNGEIQLTGWKTGKDDKLLSHSDIEEIAVNRLKEFKQNREKLDETSLITRFKNLIIEARKLKPKFKCYTKYRHLGGDTATILDDGDLWIDIVGVDYQFKATGKKDCNEAIIECTRIFEEYIGATISQN